jgi:raffinose/stachyose/melibiose transport system substrate-binding protein
VVLLAADTRSPAGPTRRTLLRTAALGALAVPALAACSSGGGSHRVRFYQSKPEVIGYFDKLVATFNQQNRDVQVVHDSSSSLVASFVRESPHDIVCNNYDLSAGTFVSRGVLSSLASVPEISRINPNVQALVGQYATPAQSTDVIPYSIAAAGVIYNKDLFDQHGVDVPTTWTQLLDACRTFQSAGVTPIYMTFKDPWTIQQGLFDYVAGSMIDVAGFFAQLKAEGAKAGASAPVSFTRAFKSAVDKMGQLLAFGNRDAAARAYPEGNAAFAAGKAAMYLQGPWAIGEIAKANPKLQVRTFVLPSTDNPDDRRARVNLDLALWIPNGAGNPTGAHRFLSYLLTPDVMNKYNQDNLAYAPVKNPPPVTDQRIEGLQPYVRESKFYQGPGTYIPNVIPLGNYLQDFAISRDGATLLRRMDNDWERLAQRTSA